MSRTGSMLVDDVVPTVATTAIGRSPRGAILGDQLRQIGGAHARTARRRDAPDRLVAQAQRERRLVDRRVRVVGAVHARRAERYGRASPRVRTSGTATSRAAASACSVEIDAVS